MWTVLRAIWRPLATPVALLLAVALVWQSAQLVSVRAHVAATEKAHDATLTALGRCNERAAALEAGIAAQNAAVGGLQRESEARVAESARAASAARSVAESWRLQAAAVMAAQPKPGESACSAAERLIRETAR